LDWKEAAQAKIEAERLSLFEKRRFVQRMMQDRYVDIVTQVENELEEEEDLQNSELNSDGGSRVTRQVELRISSDRMYQQLTLQLNEIDKYFDFPILLF
jgi:hypothetical protein